MALFHITNLFFVLYITYIYTCDCITKSISLTPDNPSFITLLKGATSYAPFEWDLYAMDEIQFNMKIHLNKSWSFDDKYPTKLTFEIGSDTTIDSATSSSLIVSFSQKNAKYLTSVIQIGGDDDHYMYPPANSAKQSYAEGDIQSLVSQKDGTRIDKATNNGSYAYFEPFTSQPNISYPLQFVIENHPDFDYMIFSYSNPKATPRNVVYFAMEPNVDLDIYLSAGDEGDNFDITYFNILHTISATVQNIETVKNTAESSTHIPQTTANVIENNTTHTNMWFEQALVLILIATVAMLCCLFCVFGAMFAIIIKNHKKAILKHKQTATAQVPTLDIAHVCSISTPTNTRTVTTVCSPPSTATNPTVGTAPSGITPTLTDILNALAPKSASNNFSAYKVGAPQTQRDVNHVYNDLTLRYRGDTMGSGGEIEEMEENDNISEENEFDAELEAMYNPPSRADIRQATMRSDTTHTTRGGHIFGDALHVDDGVNRVSIVNLDDVLTQQLRVSLQHASGSDSDGLYQQIRNENENQEGTPFGSTDTQCTEPMASFPSSQTVIV